MAVRSVLDAIMDFPIHHDAQASGKWAMKIFLGTLAEVIWKMEVNEYVRCCVFMWHNVDYVYRLDSFLTGSTSTSKYSEDMVNWTTVTKF